MSIRENIKAKKKQMLTELVEGSGNTSKAIQTLALAAVHGGQGSDEWRTYMSLFVDAGNTKQLARLMGKDSTATQLDMNNARAYLAADGTCGSTTVINFGNGASVLLDEGVENEPTVEV